MGKWFLFAALAAVAAPAAGQQRTWTIARDVYTVDADLLAVRGDTAFLKIGDKVESVPLSNLSAADHQFISTLALAPVTPGPAGDNASAAPISGPVFPGPSGDILPLAGEEHSLIVPTSGSIAPGAATASQAYGEESLPHPTTSAPTSVIAQPMPESWNPPYANPNARANPQNNANRRPTDAEADRRFWRQQQQQQQQRQQQQQNSRNANRDDDDDDEPRERRGRLFGRDR